jgi:hypothetical protein
LNLRACAAVLLAALVGCSGGDAKSQGSPPPQSTPPPSDIADIATFAANPSDATYEPIHSDIVSYGNVDGIWWRLIDKLVSRDVPQSILSRAGGDLSTVDFVESLAYLRELNVSAQGIGTSGADVVRKSAELSWILLAFRGYGDKTALNLSRMDLRKPDAMALHAIDLSYVDFSGSILPHGTWRDVSLGGASFKDARTDGSLTCESCNWGSATGTMQFSNGQWVPQ